MAGKHKKADCAWGDSIPRIETKLDMLIERVNEDRKHRHDVDEQQYNLLRAHEGRISGCEASIASLLNNKKNQAVLNNCKGNGFWGALSSIQRKYLLILFFGGLGVFGVLGQLLRMLGEWLISFQDSTIGMP